MKIGIFDSGLGGLIVTQAIAAMLPQYDYVYLGDTARVPYGNRSAELIYQFTTAGMDFLFAQDCQIIIVACNTASAEVLGRLQREYLPQKHPQRRILGVLIPTAEAAVQSTHNNRIGVIATIGTVASQAFERELTKLKTDISVYQQATPLLVPIIESGELEWTAQVAGKYIANLLDENIDTLILGCTHYPAIKDSIRQIIGGHINLISQDEILPPKLQQYLKQHAELETSLSRGSSIEFYVTDVTTQARRLASQLFTHQISIQKINLA